MAKFYYRTWMAGSPKCKGSGKWHEIEADSKAEVIRKKKRWDNTVQVLTEEEMAAK